MDLSEADESGEHDRRRSHGGRYYCDNDVSYAFANRRSPRLSVPTDRTFPILLQAFDWQVLADGAVGGNFQRCGYFPKQSSEGK